MTDLPEASSAGLRVSSRAWTIAGAIAVVLALLSALATFLVLAGMVPVVPTQDVVLSLFVVNAVLIVVLLGVVAKEAISLVRARRAGLAAAALHTRVVGFFALVAAAPALLVAAVGWLTLERGLDIQFSRYIRGLLTTSVDVANAYRELQCRTIGREINLMAADISRARPALDQNREFFRDFMRSRAVFLGFPVTFLVKDDLSVIERIEVKPIEGLPLPSKDDIAAANDGEAWCLIPSSGYIFRGILKVPAFDNAYLIVARAVDPKALEFPQQAQQAANYYEALSERKLELKIAFASMYGLISLILLLSAIWLGLSFANRLVAPIRRLIHATDQVASGNFYVQVPSRKNEGDLGHLAATFNKMTNELRQQHDRLTAARDLIDRRRRFTEAVLSGVSAGVISIDGKGRVTALNPSAEQLLSASREKWLGKQVSEVLPELTPIVEEALGDRHRFVQTQLQITRAGQDRTLTVRVTNEQAADGEKGAIVTLDDITDLVAAQRTAAWADVARRIAHEIKNPLTPIQLSAERIRRKYGKVITTDREIFDQCTDTIVRQVDDIKRMVDEFSSFARMPKPTAEIEDIAGIVRQVLFLMRVGHPEITFEDQLPATPLMARFDRRLISQAVTNIVKNATESISAVPVEERGQGVVSVTLRSIGPNIEILVADNGKGFPTENRKRLLEPYMTTREGGTGLGLAIVGKIMEEHGGGIELLDNKAVSRGAIVRLWFPAPDLPTTVDTAFREAPRESADPSDALSPKEPAQAES
jgi:two-component system nitrogen regulation sensor histidine kinase NtrY